MGLCNAKKKIGVINKDMILNTPRKLFKSALKGNETA